MRCNPLNDDLFEPLDDDDALEKVRLIAAREQNDFLEEAFDLRDVVDGDGEEGASRSEGNVSSENVLGRASFEELVEEEWELESDDAESLG